MKDRQLWPMVSEPLAPASGASAGAEQGGRSLPSGQKEEREPGPPHALCKLHLLKLHPLTGSQAGPALQLLGLQICTLTMGHTLSCLPVYDDSCLLSALALNAVPFPHRPGSVFQLSAPKTCSPVSGSPSRVTPNARCILGFSYHRLPRPLDFSPTEDKDILLLFAHYVQCLT